MSAELWSCLHAGEADEFRSQLGEESSVASICWALCWQTWTECLKRATFCYQFCT